ncbi:MAG: hypothetical protein ACLFXM_05430 [Acidimicrobiia bacterium]
MSNDGTLDNGHDRGPATAERGPTAGASVLSRPAVATVPVPVAAPSPELAPGDGTRRRTLRIAVDGLVLGVCVVFVLLQLQPGLLISDTTPAGGDMGAHVWGPAYLRDHLLPHGQITGWSPDWYAGFPAYHFYMVVPSLAIVLLNAGIHGWAGLVPALAGAALVALAVVRRHDPRARTLAVAGAVLALALVGLPYGVAFKWVSVSGLLTLPPAAYLFGRLAGATFPTPAVMAVATLPFLFYRGFSIYGGNVPSTLAGEFAFSMSLSLALVYLGVVMRGLETGRHRALAALLLALTGLCHLIPAFFALVGTVVAVAVRARRSRSPWVPGVGLVLVGAVIALAGLALGAPDSAGGLVAAALGALLAATGLWLLSDAVRWVTPVLVVGGLLAAFWVLPFYLRRDFLNDMGWEKLPYRDQGETIWQYLIPSESPDVDLRWVLALAIVGAGLSLALRFRPGVFLVLMTAAAGVAFVVVPEGRLWNGRLLPFYYLTAMLLAAVAVSEVLRLVGGLIRGGRPSLWMSGAVTAVGALVAILVVVGLPLGALPGSARAGVPAGADASTTGYVWPSFGPVQFHSGPESFVTGWAKWNYSGYEGKELYREYHHVVRTMDEVGAERGCGRAFWEYEKELDRYGTPMALMLLPHWTDGCIGSMEGLYFEASATTPFHFLVQTELSANPSAAQRDLPYGSFDLDRGVQHLQLMGVRYYMATSAAAIEGAREHPDLEEIATSGPWAIFEVARSEVVEALEHEPAVVSGVGHDPRSWLEEPPDESGRYGGPAVRWFNDPARWPVPLAVDGPDDWQRVDSHDLARERRVEPAEVSDVEVEDDSISFEVDRVGSPVLVKMSYFPNWRVDGADGPYRVAPNFMVVVPTDTQVELRYGRTPVEWVSYALTGLGVAGLLLLARRGRFRFRPRRPPAAIPRETGWVAGDGGAPPLR